MGNVVSFKPREDPHANGDAFCIFCKHEWLAVAPVGTMQLECPSCGSLKGIWKFPFAPNEGQLVRECNCSNQLFYITPDGHVCANCGTYQGY